MGKATRIAELENEIEELKIALERANDLAMFIDELCQLPEDAILLYTSSGLRFQCEIGKAARCFRENLTKESNATH